MKPSNSRRDAGAKSPTRERDGWTVEKSSFNGSRSFSSALASKIQEHSQM